MTKNGQELLDESLIDAGIRKYIYVRKGRVKMKKIIEYAAFMWDKFDGEYKEIVFPVRSLVLAKQRLEEYIKFGWSERWDTKDVIIKKRIVETYTSEWNNIPDTDCHEAEKGMILHIHLGRWRKNSSNSREISLTVGTMKMQFPAKQNVWKSCLTSCRKAKSLKFLHNI